MRAFRLAFARYLRDRGHVLAFAALCVALPGLFSTPPPDRTVAELARLLGASTGTHVSPADVAWEPRRGLLGELVLGRPLLFLGAGGAGKARDLYRAWVRVTPGGQLLGVGRTLRLTDTTLADECGLVAHGPRAAWATASGGRVQSVTVLSLASAAGTRAGLAARLAAQRETGEFTPLERTDLSLREPAARADLTLGPTSLVLSLDGLEQPVRYDLERRAVVDGADRVRLLAREPSPDSLRIALLDLVRSRAGQRPVELAGRAYYAVKSRLARFVGRRSGADSAKSQPIQRAWLALPNGIDRAAGAPAPYFRKRELRPASLPDRARVVLVTLDLQQVELGLGAGSLFPKSALGVPGSGRTPRDAAVASRIVAVFNAGPEAPYDRYGAKAEGRLLVPAVAGSPGIVLDEAHGVSIGAFAWGGAGPAEVVAFEQRRRALVVDGVPFRALAEDKHEASLRRRSALCRSGPSELSYAYAELVDAASFARTLADAGCRDALPLASAPERLGFALFDVAGEREARSELVDEAMDLEPLAFLSGSTRDFFYVLVKDALPKNPPGVRFEPDGGTQPSPAWLPGIRRAKLPLGALEAELLTLAPGSVEYRLRPGAGEPGAKGEPWAGALEGAERSLASFELGHATSATRYGLALGTAIPLSLKPGYATLVLGSGGRLRVLLPGEAVTLGVGEQAVQLPLLADDRDVTQRARERGDLRARAALGVTAEGLVVVATIRHDSSDPLAVALRSAGCKRVLELDRGSRHPASTWRAGTAAPAPDATSTTALVALAHADRAPPR